MLDVMFGNKETAVKIPDNSHYRIHESDKSECLLFCDARESPWANGGAAAYTQGEVFIAAPFMKGAFRLSFSCN